MHVTCPRPPDASYSTWPAELSGNVVQFAGKIMFTSGQCDTYFGLKTARGEFISSLQFPLLRFCLVIFGDFAENIMIHDELHVQYDFLDLIYIII